MFMGMTVAVMMFMTVSVCMSMLMGHVLPVIACSAIHVRLSAQSFLYPFKQHLHQLRMAAEISGQFQLDIRIPEREVRRHFLNSLHQNAGKKKIRQNEHLLGPKRKTAL
ncbi:hypothetical protein D3C81_1354200 [compost metagenome]